VGMVNHRLVAELADKAAQMSSIGRVATRFQQLLKQLILNERELPGAPMSDEISTYGQRRGLAAAFTLCALAGLTLLANHPSGSPGSFAVLLKDEAAHRVIDGVVHGGFCITLVTLMICFVFLSRFLGSAKASVVIGLVCFCVGCSALIASMVLDGFATPAIAVRFAGADDLQPAKTLFILFGTLIGFLMPAGILFQSVAMFSWSSAIAKGPGLRRIVGAFGLAIAICLIVAIFAVPPAMAAHVLMGGIVLQSIWYLGIAALLCNRSSWPLSKE
jgi:hypothetical protein